MENSLTISNEMVMDETIFNEIYEGYYKRVYNYISYRINDHNYTQDLVSRVFERILLKYHQYRSDKAPLEVWIMAIARNVVADYFRETKKRSFVSIDKIVHLISGKYEPESVVVLNETNQLLIQALSTLTERDRNIVALKFAAELKNTDIADLMHISANHVGAILHRALRKLKIELEKEERGGQNESS